MLGDARGVTFLADFAELQRARGGVEWGRAEKLLAWVFVLRLVRLLGVGPTFRTRLVLTLLSEDVEVRAWDRQ